MYVHVAVTGIAAFCIALGLFYRIAAVVFFATYTWLFLIDKTEYNNHYYLICLLGFLLIYVRAHAWAALDNLWRPATRRHGIPYWHLFLFKAQICLVYFYGGIAKLNRDWLTGEPLRHWLAKRGDYPVTR